MEEEFDDEWEESECRSPIAIQEQQTRYIGRGVPRRVIGHHDLWGCVCHKVDKDVYTSVRFALYLETKGFPVELHLHKNAVDDAALAPFWANWARQMEVQRRAI